MLCTPGGSRILRVSECQMRSGAGGLVLRWLSARSGIRCCDTRPVFPCTPPPYNYATPCLSRQERGWARMKSSARSAPGGWARSIARGIPGSNARWRSRFCLPLSPAIRTGNHDFSGKPRRSPRSVIPTSPPSTSSRKRTARVSWSLNSSKATRSPTGFVRGPLPVGEALAIAKQICEALEAAHERDRPPRPETCQRQDSGNREAARLRPRQDAGSRAAAFQAGKR